MKTKTSNKLNKLLIAIVLLLLFVACFNAVDKTGSWLRDTDEIGFKVEVQSINIEIKQGERQIANGGYIYLGTDLLEPSVKYLTKTTTTTIDEETKEETSITIDNSVTITNKETGVGYYIRFQAIAMVEGVAYNINNFIKTTDFYSHPENEDNWLYSVNANKDDIVAMTAGETLTLMQDIEFSESFITLVQGQIITLHLFVEGSATGEFTTAQAS